MNKYVEIFCFTWNPNRESLIQTNTIPTWYFQLRGSAIRKTYKPTALAQESYFTANQYRTNMLFETNTCIVIKYKLHFVLIVNCLQIIDP